MVNFSFLELTFDKIITGMNTRYVEMRKIKKKVDAFSQFIGCLNSRCLNSTHFLRIRRLWFFDQLDFCFSINGPGFFLLGDRFFQFIRLFFNWTWAFDRFGLYGWFSGIWFFAGYWISYGFFIVIFFK
jgi:hypothetical protein